MIRQGDKTRRYVRSSVTNSMQTRLLLIVTDDFPAETRASSAIIRIVDIPIVRYGFSARIFDSVLQVFMTVLPGVVTSLCCIRPKEGAGAKRELNYCVRA